MKASVLLRRYLPASALLQRHGKASARSMPGSDELPPALSRALATLVDPRSGDWRLTGDEGLGGVTVERDVGGGAYRQWVRVSGAAEGDYWIEAAQVGPEGSGDGDDRIEAEAMGLETTGAFMAMGNAQVDADEAVSLLLYLSGERDFRRDFPVYTRVARQGRHDARGRTGP